LTARAASKPASVLLIDGDNAYTESAAIIRVLHSFGGVWRLLGGTLWIVPKLVRDATYRAVAKRRYRWFGRRETCYLPDPSEAVRFLQN